MTNRHPEPATATINEGTNVNDRNLRAIAAAGVSGLLLAGCTPPAAGDHAADRPAPAAAQPSEAQSTDHRDEERARRIAEALAAPNPLEPVDSVWMEDLTYMEVRDRIKDGATVAIVPTGGLEQNGPYLVTGKHNVMLESACPAVARKLGNALCAPIVPFVPEGSIDPPSGHMHYPGTISVRDSTFNALLVDIADSLKQHGFTDIVLIGDSGGNQQGLAAAAQQLNESWAGSGVTAHFIGEFYQPAWEESIRYAQEELGVIEPTNDGYHDDIYVTAAMTVTDPSSVRYEQRMEAGLASINGVDIAPVEDTIRLGEKLVEHRAGITAAAIRSALAED